MNEWVNEWKKKFIQDFDTLFNISVVTLAKWAACVCLFATRSQAFLENNSKKKTTQLEKWHKHFPPEMTFMSLAAAALVEGVFMWIGGQ